MGMTFSFDSDEQRSEVHECYRCDAYQKVDPECPLCKGAGTVTETYGVNEFHFSYSSAYELFDAIGYEHDGECYAGEFLWKDLEDYMERLFKAILCMEYPSDRGRYVLRALTAAWTKRDNINFG